MRWLLLIIVLAAAAAMTWQSQEVRRWSTETWASVTQRVLGTEPPAAGAAHGPRKTFASGTVEGAQREVNLRFEATGRLVELEVAEGALVKKGAVLAQLDAAEWEAQLSEAQASLSLARAERERLINGERKEMRDAIRAKVRLAQSHLLLASQQMARTERLLKTKNVTPQEYEEKQSELHSAEAAVDEAKARLAEVEALAREDERKMADARVAAAEAKVRFAQANVAKTRLLAPSDGRILRILAEPGEYLGLLRDQPLITMVNVDELRVRAYVEELDAFRVNPGQHVTVEVDGKPGEKFGGKVIFCSPFMIPKKIYSNSPGERVDVKVREILIRLDKLDLRDSSLVIGLPVDVHFDDMLPDAPSTGQPSSSQPPNAAVNEARPVSSRTESSPKSVAGADKR